MDRCGHALVYVAGPFVPRSAVYRIKGVLRTCGHAGRNCPASKTGDLNSQTSGDETIVNTDLTLRIIVQESWTFPEIRSASYALREPIASYAFLAISIDGLRHRVPWPTRTSTCRSLVTISSSGL